MYKRIIFVLAFAIMLPGCETIKDAMTDDRMKEENQPKYVISTHQLVKYPRANKLEIKVPAYDGRSVWIVKTPFIHSRHIEEVQMVPRANEPNFYDLKLKLTRRGRLIWMQMSVQFRHEDLALLIDGMFYRVFRPGKITTEEDTWVLLEGPVDYSSAQGAVKNAKKNYEFFNPDEGKWW